MVANKIKSNKTTGIIMAIFLVTSILNVGKTGAYYSDTEAAQGNSFAAAFLDLDLHYGEFQSIIGPEVLGEKSHASVAIPVNGSLGMRYAASASTTQNSSGLCDKIMVEAKLNGLSKYLGPLPGFQAATTTEFGSWEFRFDLPPDKAVGHGEVCGAETVFKSWREEKETPEESGYFDEEKISFFFTARMVVLNEIYPRPNEGEKEFIELYNNGNTPVDIAGWKISEISGSSGEKFYTIGSTTSSYATSIGGSTLIPAYSFLTLNLSSNIALNNTGDTVKLYDSSMNLLDSHTFGLVSEGKSLVRVPDGIGYWVDPEPTPGEPNMVSLEDLRIAGFDDSIIAEIMGMMVYRSSLICEAATAQAQVEIETPATTTGQTQTAQTQTETPAATSTPQIIEQATSTPEAIISEAEAEPEPETATSTEEIIEEIIVEEEVIEEEVVEEEAVVAEEVVEEAAVEEPVEEVAAAEEIIIPKENEE